MYQIAEKGMCQEKLQVKYANGSYAIGEYEACPSKSRWVIKCKNFKFVNLEHRIEICTYHKNRLKKQLEKFDQNVFTIERL